MLPEASEKVERMRDTIVILTKHTRMVFKFKKGNRYRPLCLSNTISKLYETFIKNLLEEEPIENQC